MRTALVTGISGQDGAYLAQLLLEKDYQVYGAYRRTSSINFWRIAELGIEQHPNLHLVEYDLTDLGNSIRLLESTGADEIYNLAAQSFVSVSFDQPATTAQITGIGALNLLEAMRAVRPQARFYQASSSEMFGKVRETPQSEATPFHPRSPYGCAKVYAYWISRNYRESAAVWQTVAARERALVLPVGVHQPEVLGARAVAGEDDLTAIGGPVERGNAFWAGGQNLFVFMRLTPGLNCNNTGEVPAVGLHEFGHLPPSWNYMTKKIVDGEVVQLTKAERLKETNFAMGHNQLMRWHDNKMARVITGGACHLVLHPWQDRTLTHREAARIQGFPDEWKIWPVRTASNISTAVLPGVAGTSSTPHSRATSARCSGFAMSRCADSRFDNPPTSRPPIALGWPVSENGPAPGFPIWPVARCRWISARFLSVPCTDWFKPMQYSDSAAGLRPNHSAAWIRSATGMPHRSAAMRGV